MRTILLSFSPEWYSDLESGRKIYEHRKRFCKEPVKAYIYLGLPYRKIVAKVELGKPENMYEWLNTYDYDKDALIRIKEFLERNRVAMPIISFQKMEPIDVRKMEKELPGFRVPISYMYIDNKPDIFKYIQEREVLLDSPTHHSFDNITADDICIC